MRSAREARSADAWFKSSFSNESNGCVEVRFDGDDVLVADSKQHGQGPEFCVPGAEWDVFVAAVVAGDPPASGALRVAPAEHGGRHVMSADGTRLSYTATEWEAFVAGAADGEFRRTDSAESSRLR